MPLKIVILVTSIMSSETAGRIRKNANTVEGSPRVHSWCGIPLHSVEIHDSHECGLDCLPFLLITNCYCRVEESSINVKLQLLHILSLS